MVDRTLSLATPYGGHRYALAGDAADDSVMGMIERTNGYYEPHLMQLLRRRLARDAIVLDVGANVGPLTLAISECCPDGHVYAFEPAAKSFGYLHRNLIVNGIANATPVQLAFYNSAAELQLSYTAGFAGGSFISSTTSEGESETIRTVRLDDWVEEQGLERLDLVKLDVEGAELRVLDGAQATLATLRPNLVIEFNPLTMRRFQDQDPWQLLERLGELYPRLYYVRHDGDTIRLLGKHHVRKLLARKGYLDLYCTFQRPASAHGGGAEQLRAVIDASAVSLSYNRWRQPAKNFVVEPSYELGLDINELRGRAGSLVRLGLSIHNTSRYWFSSRFPEHAVCASYHWLDEAGKLVEYDGIRTFFPQPLGPGRTIAVEMAVQLPLAPGRYSLLISLVQENYLWFYKVDPELGQRLPTVVA